MDDLIIMPSLAVAQSMQPSLDAPADLLARILTGSEEPWPASAKNPTKPMRPTQDDAVAAVAQAVNLTHRLLYVETLDECRILAEGSEYLYRRLETTEIRRWVLDFWKKGAIIMGAPSPKKLKDSIEMVKNYTERTEHNMSRRYISITPTLFWDTETADFTETPESACFFRLFDTPIPTQHFIKIPPFTAAQLDALKAKFKEDCAYISTHNGDLGEDYDFVTLWADYNHDVYMDILRAAASPFMRTKPFGAFMLYGMSRTGKTNFSNDLMKTMLGTANCTAVTLGDIGDPHVNNALEWTLYNAPDEESEKMTSHVEIFKTITDHGQVPLKKMYSSEPVQVDCNFPCVFPMNHKPSWAGVGVNACVTRSLVIEFTHVFNEDKNPVKFSEQTFTAEMFSRLLGTLFAVARYYRTHDFDKSPTMVMQQEALQQDMDSHSLYYSHFIAFFDGFQSIDQLYDDYKLWCRAHGAHQSSIDAFRLPFGAFTSTKQRKIKAYGKEARGYRVVQPGKKPLLNQAHYPSIGVPKDIWEGLSPCSIVEREEALLEDRFGDAAEEELVKMIAVARNNMASARIKEEEPGEQQPLDLTTNSIEPTTSANLDDDIFGGGL